MGVCARARVERGEEGQLSVCACAHGKGGRKGSCLRQARICASATVEKHANALGRYACLCHSKGAIQALRLSSHAILMHYKATKSSD